jgi:hypothetical protein
MRSRLLNAGVSAREVATEGRNRARRLSAGPALVRLVAAVAALGALTLALPLEAALSSAVPSALIRIGVTLVAVSVGVGLFPRTRWVSLVAVAVIGLWLISTIGLGEAVTLPRVGLLAAALYLMHAAAALAAVLPYDCWVAPAMLLRWLGRVGRVLGLSLLVGLGGMAVTGQLPAVRSVVGPIVGSAVAASLAGLLAWHLRRRRG